MRVSTLYSLQLRVRLLRLAEDAKALSSAYIGQAGPYRCAGYGQPASTESARDSRSRRRHALQSLQANSQVKWQ